MICCSLRSRTFKSSCIFLKWNELYWNNTELLKADFESVIILSMNLPDNSTLKGVVITAIIQFGLKIDVDTYEEEWKIISNDSKMMDNWLIDDSNIKSKYDTGT